MANYIKTIRLAAPAAELVTLAEAKAQLRVDVTDDDTLITELIKVARDRCERYCNRIFAATTAAVLYDGLPSGETPLYMPLPNVATIDAMSYVDSDAATQNIVSPVFDADYQTIRPPTGTDWPSDAQLARVEVTTEAITDDVAIKQAMLLYVTDLYEHRSTMTEVQLYENKAAIALLQPYRVEIGV